MRHLSQLVASNRNFTTPNGLKVDVFEIKVPIEDEVLSEWAKHFRNQYCDDIELDHLINGTGKNKKEFLDEVIFPDSRKAPGPSIRAGDFSEVFLSDYLQFIKEFWIPRNRFQSKAVRNESVKGSDVVAFKFQVDENTSPEDLLAVFESKAALSKDSTDTLQNSINHSAKDYLRVAETLNAIKRRYINSKDFESAKKVSRFQNPEDNPFKELFGAVAFGTTNSISDNQFFNVEIAEHPKNEELNLIVFHGEGLMDLVHTLYQRACDEA